MVPQLPRGAQGTLCWGRSCSLKRCGNLRSLRRSLPPLSRSVGASRCVRGSKISLASLPERGPEDPAFPGAELCGLYRETTPAPSPGPPQCPQCLLELCRVAAPFPGPEPRGQLPSLSDAPHAPPVLRPRIPSSDGP